MKRLLIAAPLLLAGCAIPTSAAPTVTVTATPTVEAPTADSGDALNRELLGQAFDELPTSSQQHICSTFRASPSKAWAMWEASASGASAALARSDFMAVMSGKCST